ncbi:asialoglycoprotein receptor 1-like isoform X2 [Ascaphus truei]|uniref:asialoglycoprotein receptor 1-like isoform X2 n=1 Tax=Ascaphus truei TaxID=8439 RepID=UPI003F59DBE3
MSQHYQDLQPLQVEDPSANSTVLRMSSYPWPLPPSSRLLCGLSSLSAGLVIIIIVLVATVRTPGAEPADRTVQYQLSNLSVSVHSQVKRLSEEGNKLMEKLKETDNSVKQILTDMSKDSQDPPCPPDWDPFSGSCYFFFRAVKSWTDSKKSCESENSHLVVINTQEEQNYIQGITVPVYTWIGLTDVDGEWKWDDGTRYDSALKNWLPGQPDEYFGHGLGGGEDCAHLHRKGQWNDDHCSRHYSYICEKSM